jgi:hypothetical protein
LLFLLIAFFTIATAMAADDDFPPFKAGKNAFKAKLISYDAERNLIRITTGSGGATLIVDKNVKLTVDYHATDRKLADFPADTNFGVVVNSEKSTVLELHVMGPVITRTLESIDLEKRTMRVVGVPADKKDETLPFIKGARVTKGYAEASLDDVKPGLRVALQLTTDKSTVLAIGLVPPMKKKQ